MPCEVARRVERYFGTFFDPVAQRRVLLDHHAIFRNRINRLDGQISAALLDNASMRSLAPWKCETLDVQYDHSDILVSSFAIYGRHRLAHQEGPSDH